MFVGTDLYHRVGEVADICATGHHACRAFWQRLRIHHPATIDHSKLQQKRRAEANLTFEKMIDAEKEDARFAASLKAALTARSKQASSSRRIVSAEDLALQRAPYQRVERPMRLG